MEPYRHLNRSIAGKTAIITGAASGMGRATAHLFAREGANVAVTDLKQENVDIVVQEIKDAGFENVHGLGQFNCALPCFSVDLEYIYISFIYIIYNHL